MVKKQVLHLFDDQLVIGLGNGLTVACQLGNHGNRAFTDELMTLGLCFKLLKQENLDLKLTPYKVIATGIKEGFLQFVDAMSVSTILVNEKGIKEFLKRNNPSDTDRHGITASAMDSYVRSSSLRIESRSHVSRADFSILLTYNEKPAT